MKKLTLFIVILFIFMVSPVWAFRTGNEMLQSCNEAIKFMLDRSTHPDLTEANKCVFFLDGMIQMNSRYNSLFETPNTNLSKSDFHGLFCSPSIIDLHWDKPVRIVVRYLKDHPEKLFEEAIVLSTSAMQEAYPCPESKPDK